MSAVFGEARRNGDREIAFAGCVGLGKTVGENWPRWDHMRQISSSRS